MEINALKQPLNLHENAKSKKVFLQFEKLLIELRKKELPDETVTAINKDVEEINSIIDSGKKYRNRIRRKQTRMIQTLEKELKLVPKNYYRNLWMAIGMAAFGIPLGVAFGVSLDNMAFIGIGLPIGMVIGVGVGAAMDKKASKEGRQLDIEIEN